jgi:hypothetical protein
MVFGARREEFARDERVPPFESWPESGISGVVGAGPNVGQPVLARLLHLEGKTWADAYVLWLPVDPLEWAERDAYLESDSTDKPRSNGGGLIDYLTTKFDVTWTTDEAAFRSAEKYWAQASGAWNQNLS